MKLLFTFLLFCPLLWGQSLPDAPQPSPKMDTWKEFSGQDASFWTYRASNKYGPTAFWDRPPLRTNRQMFKSKTYMASMIGADLAMIVACRNKRSGEDWGSEVPAALGIDAFAYVGGRFFAMPYAVGPELYKIIHYSMSAAK